MCNKFKEGNMNDENKNIIELFDEEESSAINLFNDLYC